MNSFIAWVGGKRILAKTIVSMLPKHRTYIEVFGGAGWVLFKKDPSEVEVWNDKNSDLVNLYRVIRKSPEEFKRRQYFLLSSREEYNAFQAALKTGQFKNNIDRAIAFYYCIKNSFGAGVYSSWGYGPSSKPRYNPDLEGIQDVRERLKRVYIDNLSFDRLIPNWDRKESLFYCDPPYYMLLEKTGRAYYQHEFTAEDHTRLRDTLKGIDGRFILSYDDHPEVRKLYKRFNVQATEPVLYSTNNRPGNRARRGSEVLVTNF